MALYSDEQRQALLLTEQVASAFSLVGCAFVIITFLASSRFRKPVNRLIFYAVWGNILYTISTLISINGPAAGAASPLCQFQGFMIQAFLPADALWNLTMAINVYLTVFKNNDAARLRAREPYYIAFNYGVPFVIALVYCFISTPDQGKMYGPAILWCWITTEWEIWRVITCYLIGWLCMLSAFAIYVLAGREIFRKRRQLRAFSEPNRPHPKRLLSFQSSGPASPSLSPCSPTRGFPDLGPGDAKGIRVTSEITKSSSTHVGAAGLLTPDYHVVDRAPRERAGNPFEPYSVTIEYGDTSARSSRTAVPTLRQRNKAMEANTAAWGYTKCCILFFLSMLVTWVRSHPMLTIVRRRSSQLTANPLRSPPPSTASTRSPTRPRARRSRSATSPASCCP